MHAIPTHVIKAFDGSRRDGRPVNPEIDVIRARFENKTRHRSRRAR